MADMRALFRHISVMHCSVLQGSSIFYINTQHLRGPSNSQQFTIHVVQLQTVANRNKRQFKLKRGPF